MFLGDKITVRAMFLGDKITVRAPATSTMPTNC
jgi:hypothetical protein